MAVICNNFVWENEGKERDVNKVKHIHNIIKEHHPKPKPQPKKEAKEHNLDPKGTLKVRKSAWINDLLGKK